MVFMGIGRQHHLLLDPPLEGEEGEVRVLPLKKKGHR
jgi:hypothetical protein